MYFELRDGTRVLIRPIAPDDKPLLAEGLQRLSAETVRRRFLVAKPRFTSAELRYLTEVDGVDHIALAAVHADFPDFLFGVARCVRLHDEPDSAEMAIVIGDPWQGQGLGRELAARLAEAALAVGIRSFAATTLADNEPARRLMHTFGLRPREDRASGGLREVVVELAPTPLQAAPA